MHRADLLTIEVTVFTSLEFETRHIRVGAHIAALDADESALPIVVRYLEPVTKGIETAEPDYGRMQMTCAVEKLTRLWREPWMLKVPSITCSIKRPPLIPLKGGSGFVFLNDDVVLVGEPLTSLNE